MIIKKINIKKPKDHPSVRSLMCRPKHQQTQCLLIHTCVSSLEVTVAETLLRCICQCVPDSLRVLMVMGTSLQTEQF